MPAETVFSSELQQTFRLGRLRNPNPRRGLILENYLFPTKESLPPETHYRDKARNSLSQVYGNDREGDCVIAGEAHLIGNRSANDNNEVVFTTRQILDWYHKVCGPGDNGCMIDAVLDRLVSEGLYGHKLAGWARFNGKSADLHRASVQYFGGTTYGINLPAQWANSFRDGAIWDDTNSPSVGGHEIVGVDYDSRGVYCATWGGVVLVTWKALANTRIVEECYVSISEDWLGPDKVAPGGLDLGKLQAAMRAIQGGNLPPEPTPVPPAPPVPPGPEVAVVTMLTDVKVGTYALVPMHMGAQLPLEAAQLFGGFLEKIDWAKFASCTALCAVQSVKTGE